MKLSIDLAYQTPKEWGENIWKNFNSFLQDHADCERKASAMAMSFVAKCPDKILIIPELIETALEELEHFKLVYQLMEKRGVQLISSMPKDAYMESLIGLCRATPSERLLDRMMLASIIECRGAERFKLVAETAQDEDIKKFYKMLWTSEAKHGNIFVKLALNYWPESIVMERLIYLNNKEGEICEKLPWRFALH
jgi:tRNA 2-(methylsulfanyl)-N6-isopentenyladenosine37 hydroxylase